jgi:hypothetical protein
MLMEDSFSDETFRESEPAFSDDDMMSVIAKDFDDSLGLDLSRSHSGEFFAPGSSQIPAQKPSSETELSTYACVKC